MNTRVLSIGSALLAATAGLALSAPKADALAFNLQFDGQIFENGELSPLVGTGTFSFDGDLADGAYTLNDLSNFDFSISLGANTFGNDNIFSDLDAISVILFNQGQEASFNDLGFLNDSNPAFNILLAEPGTFFAASSNFTTLAAGNYSATAVPTPALLPGLIGMGIGVLRKRRAEQEVKQEA